MAANKDLNRLKVILVWCTNSSQPPLEMLMKITRLLDVDLKDLVRFEELDK